ncbi:hypothetical protein DFH94DRAFT_811822 [Russula ochroleuca]|uniref:Uncharacterized protein n=1 Tax=Russula ochroleuca TaxID=152965 RepID=A0A9P5MP58_9AGAM|nr:hypothetical protein DFH94DRAFT_811822 [Russula ochroleuca]
MSTFKTNRSTGLTFGMPGRPSCVEVASTGVQPSQGPSNHPKGPKWLKPLEYTLQHQDDVWPTSATHKGTNSEVGQEGAAHNAVAAADTAWSDTRRKGCGAQPTSLSKVERERIKDTMVLMVHAWEEDICKAYGAGLLMRAIPEQKKTLASQAFAPGLRSSHGDRILAAVRGDIMKAQPAMSRGVIPPVPAKHAATIAPYSQTVPVGRKPATGTPCLQHAEAPLNATDRNVHKGKPCCVGLLTFGCRGAEVSLATSFPS